MDKLKKLEIQRLLKEYDLLVLGDEYKQEIVDNYTTEFMKDILGEGPNEKKENPEPKKEEPKKEKLIQDDELDAETKKMLKKVFRDVMKKTHPDIIKTEEYLDFYRLAKEAYDTNNIVELVLIASKLNVDFELNEKHVEFIKRIIEIKKKEMEAFQKSYLYMWAHAKSPAEKKAIVELFKGKLRDKQPPPTKS